jgi:hypothetical protein
VAPRGDVPTRAVIGVPGLDSLRARRLAEHAANVAYLNAPRSSGRAARRIRPIWGEGWFGVQWLDEYLWYQEAGIRPFTMNNLAGKTIPMWVNDEDGTEARKQKSPKTRITQDGRRQTLIFRRAARHGQRKNVWRQTGTGMQQVSVPASYPGAPGRIAVNRSQGILRAASVIGPHLNRGNILGGNVGVRWRHPGLEPGNFLARGIQMAAVNAGLPVSNVQYLTEREAMASNYRVVVSKG